MSTPEPRWLDARAVVLIHQHQLAEHGGPTGIRDTALLESSLASPKHLAGYADPDLFDLAACYGARLARNHPFVDGNKRTAWVCTRLFLRLNGRDIDAPALDKVRVMRAVAGGPIAEPDFAAWLRGNGSDPAP